MPRKKVFTSTVAKTPETAAVVSAAANHGFDRGLTTETENLKDELGFISTVQRRPKRHRTGRDSQLNLKVTPKCRADLERIADQNGWGLGETLEHLIDRWVVSVTDH